MQVVPWEEGIIMKNAIRIAGVCLVLLLASQAFAQEFAKAEYFRKAAPGQKKGEPVKGTLHVDATAKELRFVSGNGTIEFAVKHEKIKSILYERTAKPRYAAGLLIAWPLLFTKSKSHYVTVQYDTEEGNPEYAIIKLDKSNYRDALAAVEAQTGKKIDRTAES